jgi:endonuclease/exonuclease/phosphatase (EEP) superfamily protein YafD
MNVLGQNSHYQKALELIHANNPDLILIEELTFNWMENLGKTLETDYPHQILEPRNDNFGIGLFSKIPLEEKSIEFIGEANVPTILAVINYSGTTINLIGTHPMPPAGSDLSRLRNDQFDELGRIISEMQEPIIVIGDLNATPWSHHFRKFLRETGLKDSGRGRGWQPTWPAPIPPLRIPIDHALYKGDLITTSRTVLPEIGSDHLPLLVEFQNRK